MKIVFLSNPATAVLIMPERLDSRCGESLKLAVNILLAVGVERITLAFSGLKGMTTPGYAALIWAAERASKAMRPLGFDLMPEEQAMYFQLLGLGDRVELLNLPR